MPLDPPRFDLSADRAMGSDDREKVLLDLDPGRVARLDPLGLEPDGKDSATRPHLILEVRYLEFAGYGKLLRLPRPLRFGGRLRLAGFPLQFVPELLQEFHPWGNPAALELDADHEPADTAQKDPPDRGENVDCARS